MVRNKPTGWVGWSYYASAMMLVVGGLQAVAGFTALFKEEFFEVAKDGLLAFNFATWGWIHLVLGAALIVSAALVMMSNAWGRVAGVVSATLAAVANLTFLPAYPVWSVIAVVASVVVIYSLTMYSQGARRP